MPWLARLVGRGRALQILLVADDVDGPRAELYGYVNRTIPTWRLTQRSTRLPNGWRASTAKLARTKAHVDRVKLPADPELPPALADFRELSARPAQQTQSARLRNSASTPTASSSAS